MGLEGIRKRANVLLQVRLTIRQKELHGYTEDDREEALGKEEPLPSRNASGARNGVERERKEAAEYSREVTQDI